MAKIYQEDVILAFDNSRATDLTDISISFGKIYDNKKMYLGYFRMQSNNRIIQTTQTSAKEYFVATIFMMIYRRIYWFLFLSLNDLKTLETIYLLVSTKHIITIIILLFYRKM